MDTDWVGWRLEVDYRKVLFWDHFFFLPSLMTSMNKYCEISKFADDKNNYVRSLQSTLYKLVAWANRLEMKFNVNKCGVMHIGKRNLERQYQMNDRWVK